MSTCPCHTAADVLAAVMHDDEDQAAELLKKLPDDELRTLHGDARSLAGLCASELGRRR